MSTTLLSIDLLGRMIVRESGGKFFFFGELVKPEGLMNNQGGEDILVAFHISGDTIQQVSIDTGNKSPEDILEEGIPPIKND